MLRPDASREGFVIERSGGVKELLLSGLAVMAPPVAAACPIAEGWGFGPNRAIVTQLNKEKTITMKPLTLALALLLLSLGVASAQIVSTLTFTIDSPFVAGNATLPAGSYEIMPTDQQGLLEIRAVKGAHSAFFEVDPMVSVTPYQQTELTFNSYGDHLVLKDITVQGVKTGATTVVAFAETRHKKAHGTPGKVRRLLAKVKA
jgi:hypothetical protein